MLDMTKKRPKAPEPLALVNVPRNVHFGLDKSNINEKAVVILDRSPGQTKKCVWCFFVEQIVLPQA